MKKGKGFYPCVMKRVKTYYNEQDGHTYVYSEYDKDWIGFPTLISGEPDWLYGTSFKDFDLTESDRKELGKTLAKILELHKGVQ